MSRAQMVETAGGSISTWQTLEDGGRVTRGEWVVPSPTDRTLAKLAQALGLDPADVFREAGRPVPGWLPEGPVTVEFTVTGAGHRSDAMSLKAKVDKLSDKQRRAIERMVDELLEDE